MPIRNCPIPDFPDNHLCLALPVQIINPYTGAKYNTRGIVDTGATECAIPSFIANFLGYDVNSGEVSNISTGNGDAAAHKLVFSIDIYHPTQINRIVYQLDHVRIDCMENLPVVLLGVNGFLSNFELKINYPLQIFSLIR
jgi:predicted aspartyl protease